VPLDQQPILVSCQWSVVSGPEHIHAEGASPYGHLHSISIIPEGVEPPFPLCKRGVVAIGPRDAIAFSFQ
jgi:hypothetical protein